MKLIEHVLRADPRSPPRQKPDPPQTSGQLRGTQQRTPPGGTDGSPWPGRLPRSATPLPLDSNTQDVALREAAPLHRAEAGQPPVLLIELARTAARS
jgi:hypothetical protein